MAIQIATLLDRNFSAELSNFGLEREMARLLEPLVRTHSAILQPTVLLQVTCNTGWLKVKHQYSVVVAKKHSRGASSFRPCRRCKRSDLRECPCSAGTGRQSR